MSRCAHRQIIRAIAGVRVEDVGARRRPVRRSWGPARSEACGAKVLPSGRPSARTRRDAQRRERKGTEILIGRAGGWRCCRSWDTARGRDGPAGSEATILPGAMPCLAVREARGSRAYSTKMWCLGSSYPTFGIRPESSSPEREIRSPLRLCDSEVKSPARAHHESDQPAQSRHRSGDGLLVDRYQGGASTRGSRLRDSERLGSPDLRERTRRDAELRREARPVVGSRPSATGTGGVSIFRLNESDVEDATLAWLEAIGWRGRAGSRHRAGHARGRAGSRDVSSHPSAPPPSNGRPQTLQSAGSGTSVQPVRELAFSRRSH